MRVIVPLLFGIAGVAILIGLGNWQMRRLAWKEGILADIEARISAPPVPLPQHIDPEAHRYLPVVVTGQFGPGALRVLVSRKQVGAGYRVISPFRTGDRTILVDRGFIPVDRAIPPAPAGQVTVIGNLHWPDERTSATPENDIDGNIWFARDLDAMARVLEAEPVLLVVREMSKSDAPLTPLPVDTSAIPNDHLVYAITWYSLAAIWAAMTGYFLWRMRNPAKGAKP